MENPLKQFLNSLANASSLPEYDYLFTVSDAAAATLETELTEYRPVSKTGKPGGLLDFNPPQKNLPLIVVPDIHARTFFIKNLLNFELPEDFVKPSVSKKNPELPPKKYTVFSALEKKKIRLVLVGDLLHSELRGRKRWIDSWAEYNNGNVESEPMIQEMKEGLSALCMVMELKIAFPEVFHILKGNHENILNERSAGNFPFRKFSNEGELVQSFMANHYGEDILMLISCFEKCLPLLAASPNCLISHAEPAGFLEKRKIIDGLSDDFVIRSLTWTENGSAQDGSVFKMIQEFCSKKKGIYLAGHRPVKENFLLRQNGLFVQIHNPEKQNIALVYKNKKFNPEKHIVSVEK